MIKLLVLTLFSSSLWAWSFSERSIEVGLNYSHEYGDFVSVGEPQMIAGGLAIGDLNGDGWDDIFAVTGKTVTIDNNNLNPNKLFIAQADGTFLDMSEAYGLSSDDSLNSGALIVDLNEDGYRDLIFGSVASNSVTSLYLNQFNSGLQKYTDHQIESGKTYAFSASDTDKDGDLDLMISHWLNDNTNHYWVNQGGAVFSEKTSTLINLAQIKNTFTPIFVDINDDNWDDLLMTSDFSTSEYFINVGNAEFEVQNSQPITDENGMGGAAGDFDNDGDMDWFVSSIYDPDLTPEGNWGVSGNRLYQNNEGVFTDVSQQAGVREGYWGWGACFADFNNDMYLDIFHVNGFPSNLVNEPEFENDLSRLFINNQDGTFTEMSQQLGLVDSGMGRAIICFDNDRDGDIDILINNNQQASSFYQNDLDNGNHYIAIKLQQSGANMDAIGAKIYLTVNGVQQMRQVMAGGSFASSNPTTQHFGLGSTGLIDELRVVWPDGSEQVFSQVTADRLVVLNKGGQIPSVGELIPVNHLSILIALLILFMTYHLRFRSAVFTQKS